jgi:hypothetical protein
MAHWADEQYDNAVNQFRAAIRLRAEDERSRLALADVLVRPESSPTLSRP